MNAENENNKLDHQPPALAQNTETRPSLFDWDPDTAVEKVSLLGAPRYRAGQVLEWLFRHKVNSFDDMSNLPKALRAKLEDDFTIFRSTVIHDQHSIDGTRKLLLRWPDQTTSECVLIPEGTRRTACISTQVGCPAGCVFCASGIGGLVRNLDASEIIEQAVRVSQICGEGERLSNVVFMGLGEPLANFNNTVKAVRTINGSWGLGIAARKITVSTVGLPGQMRRLADLRFQITLALSLHAPTDDLRREIIPWGERVSIDELVDACRYYFDQTGREVTLEYILLGGLNDSAEHAKALASVAKRMRAFINLLSYNPVAGLPYLRPTDEDAEAFLDVLKSRGVNSHLRRSRGLDVDAACGQLRRRQAQTIAEENTSQAEE
ncbi:MAG: 23S rRNA (adenine(2503)-C(2))-methyltransferase RlmN [Phycisphaerae bacterium]